MGKKTTGKKYDFREAARNAVTGYTAVILSIICFILGLMLLIAVVRFGVGLSLPATPTTVQGTPTQVQAVRG